MTIVENRCRSYSPLGIDWGSFLAMYVPKPPQEAPSFQGLIIPHILHMKMKSRVNAVNEEVISVSSLVFKRQRRVPFVYLQHSVSRLPPRSTSTSRFCLSLWPQIYSTIVSTMMQASGTKCVSSNVSRSRWLFWRYTSLGISMK